MSDNRVDTNRPEYSWIPFFEELARRLHEDGWRDRQPEIVAELQRMRRDGMRISRWVENLTEWIDPFSLIGTMRRDITFGNMLKIMASFKSFFGVTAELPIESPITPKLNNQSSFFFTNVGENGQTEIHWNLFERVMSVDSEYDDSEVIELLNQSVAVRKVSHPNLSGALFWIKPHHFLKTDTIAHFLGTKRYADFGRDYNAYLSRMRESQSSLFPLLNAEEWLTRGIGDANNVWSMNAGEGGFAREWWLEGRYVALDWGVKGIDLAPLSTEEEVGDALAPCALPNHAVAQFVDLRLNMRRGDVVVIRSKDPGHYHFGVVCSDLTFHVAPGTDADIHLNRKGVVWYTQLINAGDLNLPGLRALQSVVTDKDEVLRRIMKAIRGGSSSETKSVPLPVSKYSIDTMLAEGVFLDEDELTRIMAQLERKQSLILQGPPGTGKTFLAKRLAYALMGERADERVASVQFHQSYAYEDFVGGYRPGVNDDDQLVFKPQDGAFLKLCERARAASPDDKFVMLIDEINRGNLSRVFGELLMLIEADKRSPEHAVELQHQIEDAPVDDGRFFVPPNVYIIGTMNLADRSLTGMNVAMRRRFAFAELRPRFDTQAFRDEVAKARMPDAMLDRIVERMGALNKVIADDASLGRQYAVGHSFFCPDSQMDDDSDWDSWYEAVVEYEIRPLLEEYWFDDAAKAAEEVGKLIRQPATQDSTTIGQGE